MSAYQIQEAVARMVLDHCRNQYDELCGIWRDIERKAQGTVAIASAHLAGMYVLLRFLDSPSRWEAILILTALAALLVPLFCAMRALVVSEVECMDDSTEIRKAAHRILSQASEGDAQEALRGFVDEHAARWEELCSALHQANEAKSSWVLWAQRSLGAAIIVTVVALAASLIAAQLESQVTAQADEKAEQMESK